MEAEPTTAEERAAALGACSQRGCFRCRLLADVERITGELQEETRVRKLADEHIRKLDRNLTALRERLEKS